MRSQPDNTFSAIVTDPPYGLHFMNKGWDKFSKEKLKIGRKELGTHTNSAAHEAARYDENRNDQFEEFMYEFGKEALRIVKPGGHMLMFGAPRRYHRQACGIENAGWEIRDCLMWLFGSGFPKSHNHFGIEGFGTALKPAYEPILLCMKPLDGTFKQNAEKWGQAGINIDACRIQGKNPSIERRKHAAPKESIGESGWVTPARPDSYNDPKPGELLGRWPANLILDEEAGAMLGKPSRFFYCPKASSSERNAGLDKPCSHPTVKPLKLMEYLIKLVMPPKDGILLDPFAGSGTTILAAQNLGFNAIGIEKEKEYCEIAEARLKHGSKQMSFSL